MIRLAPVLAIVLLAVPRLALSQEPSAEPKGPSAAEPTKPQEKTPTAARESLDHRYQFGLGIRAGTGYRVIAPYHEEYCGQKTDNGDNKSVCGGRQPFWLELSPSFGITPGLEVLLDVRLYLENDSVVNSKAWFLAPGLKYYTDPDSLFKFFLTGQLVLENQNTGSSTLPSWDIGIRSALGLQFDVLRYVGLYAQGGVIVGFKRWLTFLVDFSGGVQLRY
jgi:hypothetical protein